MAIEHALRVKARGQIFSLTISLWSKILHAEIDKKMELRWEDAEERPAVATLYFMVGAERQHISYEERLERITFFETCILIFEKTMRQCLPKMGEKEVEALANSKKLPRIKILEAYTETEGFKKLFRHFGNTADDSNWEIDWRTLVGAAKKGDIVKTWIAQKQKERREKNRKKRAQKTAP